MLSRDQPHSNIIKYMLLMINLVVIIEGTDYSLSSSHGSSSEVASIRNTSTVTFHGWKYKHYFVLLNENDKNLKVCCTLRSGKTLLCARNTTSNF